jgi:hypothetical protein
MAPHFGSRALWLAVLASSASLAIVAGPAAGAPAGGGPLTPLRVTHSVALHLHLSSVPDELVAAEGPDGAVFFASGSVVHVVDGDSAPTVAVHVGAKVVALAASTDTLYAETDSRVIAYSRSTGAKTGSWLVGGVGSFVPSLVSVAGVVWSYTSPATDESGLEPATLRLLQAGKPAQTITPDAYPGQIAVDPLGDVFYPLFSGRLARTTPADVTIHSTAKTYADAAIVYTGQTLLAEIDGAKTTDEAIDPTTLAVIGKQKGHSGDYFGLVDTTAGLLHLDLDCSHDATCSDVSVRRITPPDTASGSLKVAFGNVVLGPKPVVISSEAGHNATLRRLS